VTVRKASNLLITGGCGFIGSAMIRWLFRNPEFKGHIVNVDLLTYAGNVENVAGHVDESRYHFLRADIRDAETIARACREHEIDTIVHFAAESHVDRSIDGPLVFIETNVVGTAKLLEVVRGQPHIHFHHVSTDEVYGSLGPTGAFLETTPYDPRSPYSASKAGSDHLVSAYAHTFGLSTTMSNCSNNYGAFQFPEKLIPLMILNMLEGKPLPIYGDGGNIRDWLHVDDHVEAIWTIVTRGQTGETYNVGGRAERTNLQLIDMLVRIVSRETNRSIESLEALKTFVKDRPGHDRRYAIDFNKIERALGWQPRHDLEAGLTETVQWYLSNKSWVENVRSGAYRAWIEKNYGDRAVQA
jgi:dTDP-glucose 4,6-dehydratase